ncbi:MAG: MBL fold metallo-hydrolase, partial [Nocardioides sp.]|nr:MBL fold metallo-hydrolase [Nocardioides sp.]
MITTATAVSPDSGEHWSAPGAWQVAEGIHRIPLPLPMDGLKAVNVYVLSADDGLTLVDGGWAVTEGREALEAGLAKIGAGFGDIRRFLVTHVHRDHYTLASALAAEFGAEVTLGVGEKPMIALVNGDASEDTWVPAGRLLAYSGAHDLAEKWDRWDRGDTDLSHWRYPDVWLEHDQTLSVAGRSLDAVHTPGHTQGHFVYADQAASLLFAGDHVLPTITPSIGFEPVPVVSPLGDFTASLTKVRSLPDLRVLPAHGPVAPSSHTRVDELLAHHEHRLALSLASLQA